MKTKVKMEQRQTKLRNKVGKRSAVLLTLKGNYSRIEPSEVVLFSSKNT